MEQKVCYRYQTSSYCVTRSRAGSDLHEWVYFNTLIAPSHTFKPSCAMMNSHNIIDAGYCTFRWFWWSSSSSPRRNQMRVYPRSNLKHVTMFEVCFFFFFCLCLNCDIWIWWNWKKRRRIEVFSAHQKTFLMLRRFWKCSRRKPCNHSQPQQPQSMTHSLIKQKQNKTKSSLSPCPAVVQYRETVPVYIICQK